MPGKRHTTEQIARKLRQAEVLLGRGQTQGISADRAILATRLLSLADGIRWAADRSGTSAEGIGMTERPAEEAGSAPFAGQHHPA